MTQNPPQQLLGMPKSPQSTVYSSKSNITKSQRNYGINSHKGSFVQAGGLDQRRAKGMSGSSLGLGLQGVGSISQIQNTNNQRSNKKSRPKTTKIRVNQKIQATRRMNGAASFSNIGGPQGYIINENTYFNPGSSSGANRGQIMPSIPDSINRHNLNSIDSRSQNNQHLQTIPKNESINVMAAEGEDISPILNGIQSQLTNLEMDEVNLDGHQ